MKENLLNIFKGMLVIAVMLLSGCAATGSNPADPWEGWNRKVYDINTSVDNAVTKPLAKGYKAVTPDVVEKGISNIFSNLDDVPNSLNNLLQGKPKDSLSDLGRFVVNSTLGIAGLWDPASKMGLTKHDEDFGQTLAVWGVGDGPYVMLPIFGPSTVRDTFGKVVDSQTDLTSQIDHIPTRNQISFTELLDQRAGLLAFEEQLAGAADEYVFIRDVYLQNRKYKIYDGEIPLDDEFECEEEDEDDCDF
jgi:phospholipid-binding lipoprotein MlaA